MPMICWYLLLITLRCRHATATPCHMAAAIRHWLPLPLPSCCLLFCWPCRWLIPVITLILPRCFAFRYAALLQAATLMPPPLMASHYYKYYVMGRQGWLAWYFSVDICSRRTLLITIQLITSAWCGSLLNTPAGQHTKSVATAATLLATIRRHARFSLRHWLPRYCHAAADAAHYCRHYNRLIRHYAAGCHTASFAISYIDYTLLFRHTILPLATG